LTIVNLLAPAAVAQSVGDFYRGKHIILLVASPAGGGYDAYARLVTRHLGRFIPGNPTFIVENLSSGGGAVAASNIYNLAPKDGTTIGMFQRETLVAPLLESRNIDNRFDAQKFNWLGSLNSEVGLVVAWHTALQMKFEDLFTQELVVGSTGPSTDFLPIFMNNVLHTKFKIIQGYPGSVDVYNAMERGEVQGRISNGWSGDKNILAPWLAQGKVRFLAALALEKSELFPDLPTILDFAKSPADRQVISLLIASQFWGRPFALPPNVPPDRVAALRNAFDEMTKDPDFLADAKKLDLDLAPIAGQRIDEVLAQSYRSPPDIIDRARRAIGAD
jgi:tripartite-type tricarboxylate transporter receptor subunit TctC